MEGSNRGKGVICGLGLKGLCCLCLWLQDDDIPFKRHMHFQSGVTASSSKKSGLGIALFSPNMAQVIRVISSA